MPTIAEIIAAKKAAAAPKPATITKPEGRKETLAERVENDAIAGRLAPVKPTVATAARTSAGLILNKDMPCKPEARGQATPIAGPPEPRSLSETELQAVPVVPLDADPATALWHEVMNSLDTELCVMRDPRDAEACWLAVRPDRPGLKPILIHRLPWLLWEHPQAARPDHEPF